MNETQKTTCPYCGVGCGVLVQMADGVPLGVKGDPAHPANQGRLCSKGTALADTLDMDGRLLYPEVNGERCDWDDALDHVAGRFRNIIEQHGPDAVAFYVSGQLLTEDYYIANKLMKGYIGSANIDTNSRLCMASSVAGHKRAFGSDTVPGCYDDLEQAKLVVLTGSNTAWCHPVIYQRIARARKDNPDMRVVVIDPRRTASCDIADLHLPLQSGSDALLFNGLLTYLHEQGLTDKTFVGEHTEGLEAALETARKDAPNAEATAAACGLDAEDVATFFQWYEQNERSVTVYSQGINQSSSGSDKVNAIINCHLLTGRIGRPGMGPFSVTGQPNAMGGREVGALSNQLACHMDFAAKDRDRVQRFWNSPDIATAPGLKAVDLFKAIEEGRIKAVWVMATNPLVSLPNAQQAIDALEKCELVVVSDCMRETDTVDRAHVRLPALAWGEKDGTVTNSERRISRQRAFIPAPGEAKSDWWILAQVAQRMGYSSGFGHKNQAEIFREYAALSGFENRGSRDFDISALSDISDDDYQTLCPFQWPVTPEMPLGQQRLFADGQFFTPNRRARFLPIQSRPVVNAADRQFPMSLNSGRVRDHWHTMTRTGKSARLSSHTCEPYVEVHPTQAAEQKLRDGDFAKIVTTWGEARVRVKLSDGQRPGSLFVPMHWNEQFSSSGSLNRLINPEVDPVSGQPEFKHTPARLEAWKPRWHGFMLSRRQLDSRHIVYWARHRGQGLWQYELAGEEQPADWAEQARGLLCNDEDARVEWSEFFDPGTQRYRAARLVDGQLESCIFIGPDKDLPPRSWLSELFDDRPLESEERRSLLSATPMGGMVDDGPIICACFSVGLNSIVDAIRSENLQDVDAIGAALKAGTNCGSCRPELQKILNEAEDAA